jgi:signal transduction histidine kinase
MTFLRSLYGKLAAVLLGLFLVIGILYVGLILVITHMHLQQVDQRLHRRLAEYLVSHRLFLENGGVREEAFRESFDMLMSVNPRIELYLLDRDGRILAHAAPPGRVKLERISLEPVRRFFEERAVLPILGDDPRHPGERKAFSAAPFPTEGPVQGYLYVVLSGETHESVAAMLEGNYLLQLSLWGILAGLLFLLATALFLFRLLTRRLWTLTTAVERFRESGFSEPMTLPRRAGGLSGDEIDRLGEIFEEMSGHMAAQLGDIREADRHRREIVSGISHDLRTPIASLQGYIETLLMQGGVMDPPEREGYLAAALKSVQRLGRHVDELFELAKLDSPETRAVPEPFHPGELVQDVVQKFCLEADRKGIDLSADFALDLPFVHADISLIERALENLIDNAVRYTQEGGRVRVAVAPVVGKVRVAVSDNGPGIDKGDLPHIFDRFFRGKGSAREDAAGTGLGLAVVRRIVELHGERIEAQSPQGSGTTVWFTLPVRG